MQDGTRIRLVMADIDLVASAAAVIVPWVLACRGVGFGGRVLGHLLRHAGRFVGVGFVGSGGHFDWCCVWWMGNDGFN